MNQTINIFKMLRRPKLTRVPAEEEGKIRATGELWEIKHAMNGADTAQVHSCSMCSQKANALNS